MKGTVRCPPFRVCLCATVESGIASAAAASSMGPGTDAQQGPRVGTGRRRTETKRDRGQKGGRVEGRPPSPYIISSPERVAIISRQWPTDRSASQKGPGPIIAATHRPRRSGQSSGALRAFSSLSLSLSLPLFFAFFLLTNGIPPPLTATRPARRRLRTDASRRNADDWGTGYCGGMRRRIRHSRDESRREQRPCESRLFECEDVRSPARWRTRRSGSLFFNFIVCRSIYLGGGCPKRDNLPPEDRWRRRRAPRFITGDIAKAKRPLRDRERICETLTRYVGNLWITQCGFCRPERRFSLAR